VMFPLCRLAVAPEHAGAARAALGPLAPGS
jgi:hypothetical protein